MVPVFNILAFCVLVLKVVPYPEMVTVFFLLRSLFVPSSDLNGKLSVRSCLTIYFTKLEHFPHFFTKIKQYRVQLIDLYG
jgi:hypothetical protein